MTTSTRSFSLPQTPTDIGTTRTWAYSETTPISPTHSHYQGPAFYGALMTDHTNGPVNFGQTGVVDNSTDGDRIAISLFGSGENTARIQGLIFFKKEEFVNVGSATVTFDSTSEANISWGFYGSSSGGVRAGVMDGSTWHLSESVGSGFGSSLTINDLAAENLVVHP